jgi:HSP20 family protein
VEDFYDLMNQLLQDFTAMPPVMPGAAGRWVAPADIEETDDAYLIEAELPGVRPEDVDMSLRGNELRITGEIREKERTGILRRRMRRFGQFELVVTLPGEVNPDNVEAHLNDGVLMVRVAKATTARDRHIMITNGGRTQPSR